MAGIWLPIEELACLLDERKTSKRKRPDLSLPHFLKQIGSHSSRRTDSYRTIADLLAASISIEMKLDAIKSPCRSSKALSMIIALTAGELELLQLRIGSLLCERKLGLVVFELQVLDDVFGIVETPHLKLTDDDFINLTAANDAAMIIGAHFCVKEQNVSKVLQAITAVHGFHVALPDSEPAMLPDSCLQPPCKTVANLLPRSCSNVARDKVVKSEEQAPSEPSKNVIKLIYEGDLIVIKDELQKFVNQKNKRYQNINSAVLDALAEMAELYATAEYILMLFDALPMVEAFLDVRVNESYWRLMRALFVALPSFREGSDAFCGLYRKQRNTLTPRLNISKMYEGELERLMTSLRVEGVLSSGWNARQLVNLWLFNIWLNAKLRSKRLVCYCLNSAVVFNMLEELFTPSSPLLKISAPFRSDHHGSVDKPILLGIVEQQMTPAELNTDLIEIPKWRGEAYGRLLLAMCCKRSADQKAVDASRILFKHAIPLLKLGFQDVALHIIYKMVGCPDITINWDKVETSFDQLYQLLAADVLRQDPLTLTVLSAMLKYRDRSRVASVEPRLMLPDVTPETSVDDELSNALATAAGPILPPRSLHAHSSLFFANMS
uniref:Uncharacterized protein n=1 Tax=Plectus sambesii TaxID=2011161 RepID=A0A914X7Z2_9BILA